MALKFFVFLLYFSCHTLYTILLSLLHFESTTITTVPTIQSPEQAQFSQKKNFVSTLMESNGLMVEGETSSWKILPSCPALVRLRPQPHQSKYGGQQDT